MSENTVTYDQVPPKRPGIDDVGGGVKENHPKYPPDPRKGLTAEDWNQLSKQIVEMCAALPVAVLSIDYTTGTPAIAYATGMGTAAKNPLTYTVADTGTGVVTITWPANTFPGKTAKHKAGVTGATPGSASCETITNGVIVRLLNAAGAAADLAFTVDIYGQ